MKGALVVFKKELYSIFASPIFYAASFIFFVVAGYFFYTDTLYFNILSFQATKDPFLSERLNLTHMVVTPFFGDLSTILLLMLPLITMRLYSEERKTGTIELLFTYPLSDVATLMGKYFATLLVLVIMVAGTLPYMILLESFASLDWGVVISGYIGIFLLGSSFIALGLFTSSLTENQIIAAVLSFGALLLFWALVWAKSFLGPVAGRVVELISIVTHLEPFSKGVVDTKHILYYVLFVLFWLFLTLRFLKARYWRGSYHNVATSLFVLCICVFLVLISERHYIRWDLTSYGEYTLSDKTIAVLKQISKPVKIMAFVRKGFQEEEDAKKLLSAYHYYARTIRYELIDPERNPASAKKYEVRDVNTFILEGYGRTQRTNIADEEHITNALVRLLHGKVQKVYWITGHGERDFRGTGPQPLSLLAETLSKQDYAFSALNLMEQGIPRDAALVVLAGPQTSLFPEEIASLQRYVCSGGRLLLFLEPYHDAGLKEFLEKFGIRIYPDMVVDKLSRVMGGDYLLPMVADYGDHKITHGFKLTSLFYMARSIEPVPVKTKGITVTPLAYTSEHAWGEMDKASIAAGRVTFDTGDRKGPLCLAAICELRPPIVKKKGKGILHITGEGRLVVFGDVDCASNRYFQLSGNADLITNTVHYLAARKGLISIPKKHRPIEALMLSRRQGIILFWVPVVCIPMVVLVLGIWTWLRRRSR